MRSSKHLAKCVGATLLLFAPLANADSIRCEDAVVHTGASQHRTRSLCGEPNQTARRYERESVERTVTGPCSNDPRRLCQVSERHTREITIDEWTYDFGKRRLLHHLTFRDGELVAIRTDGYGGAGE